MAVSHIDGGLLVCPQSIYIYSSVLWNIEKCVLTLFSTSPSPGTTRHSGPDLTRSNFKFWTQNLDLLSLFLNFLSSSSSKYSWLFIDEFNKVQMYYRFKSSWNAFLCSKTYPWPMWYWQTAESNSGSSNLVWLWIGIGCNLNSSDL